MVGYLSITRDGLFVFLNNVLRTQAILSSSNLRAGVSTNAVGCESACTQRGRRRVRDEMRRLHFLATTDKFKMLKHDIQETALKLQLS